MPRGDRTGPNGMGPKTGRAMGFCTGNRVPGYENPGAGSGFGMRHGMRQGFGGGGFGRGGGFGFRNRYYATGQAGWGRGWRFTQSEMPEQQITLEESRAQEIQELKSQSEALLSEMNALKARLAELEGSPRE